MATVYIGRMSGAAGFSRTVAIKRLHPHLAADSTFLAMFVDEARLAARIRHPNVIDTLDVVAEGGELFIVMDFVLGETLAKLVRLAAARSIQLPPPVVSTIIIGALEGLHAAHEAVNERGEPLGIVHRDVSPQNILVARDGVPRVLDFGVAKARGRIQETEGSELKGKLAYMAPEQLTRQSVDRRCDLFAMGVVLWEALTSRRLFAGEDAASTLYAIINEPVAPPSSIVPSLPPALDQVVLRALDRDPSRRYATAQEMALALEAACPPAPQRQAGRWVEDLAEEQLRRRAEVVATAESASLGVPLPGIEDVQLPSGAQRISSEARLATPHQGWPNGAPQPLGYSAPIHQPGMSGVGGLSGVTSGSGISGTASGITGSTVAGLTASGIQPTIQNPQARLSSHAIAAIGGLFAALLVVGVVLGVKGVTARKKQHPSPTEIAPGAPPPPALGDPPRGPEPSSRASEVPSNEAKTEGGGLAATSSAAAPSAPSASAAAKPAFVPHTSAPKAKTSSGASTDCENPFTVDANGVKYPKPQCFGH